MRLTQDRVLTVTATLGAAAVAGATAAARRRAATRTRVAAPVTPLRAVPNIAETSTRGADQDAEVQANPSGLDAGKPRTVADLLSAAGVDLDETSVDEDDVPEADSAAEDAAPAPFAFREGGRPQDSADTEADVEPGTEFGEPLETEDALDETDDVAAEAARIIGPHPTAYTSLARKFGTTTETGEQTQALLAAVTAELDASPVVSVAEVESSPDGVDQAPASDAPAHQDSAHQDQDPAPATEADLEAEPASRDAEAAPEPTGSADSPASETGVAARETHGVGFARAVSNSLTGAFVVLIAICQIMAVGLASQRDSTFVMPQAAVVALVFGIFAMRSRFNPPRTLSA